MSDWELSGVVYSKEGEYYTRKYNPEYKNADITYAKKVKMFGTMCAEVNGKYYELRERM